MPRRIVRNETSHQKNQSKRQLWESWQYLPHYWLFSHSVICFNISFIKFSLKCIYSFSRVIGGCMNSLYPFWLFFSSKLAPLEYYSILIQGAHQKLICLDSSFDNDSLLDFELLSYFTNLTQMNNPTYRGHKDYLSVW